jgi:hypothetical protein
MIVVGRLFTSAGWRPLNRLPVPDGGNAPLSDYPKELGFQKISWQ